jgi:hypothetical protein
LIAGESQAQANRNLGIHRRAKHNYISPKYQQHYAERVRRKLRAEGVLPAPHATPAQQAALKKARAVRWNKKTPEQIRAGKLAYGAKYRAAKRASKAQVTQNGMTASTAVQCKLSECPVCGARFYVAKGVV